MNSFNGWFLDCPLRYLSIFHLHGFKTPLAESILETVNIFADELPGNDLKDIEIIRFRVILENRIIRKSSDKSDNLCVTYIKYFNNIYFHRIKPHNI